MYELVAVLALASSFCALKFITSLQGGKGTKEQGSHASPLRRRAPVPLPAFVATAALAMYTHYSAFFVLAAQNLFALTRLSHNRAALIRWLMVQIMLALA